MINRVHYSLSNGIEEITRALTSAQQRRKDLEAICKVCEYELVKARSDLAAMKEKRRCLHSDDEICDGCFVQVVDAVGIPTAHPRGRNAFQEDGFYGSVRRCGTLTRLLQSYESRIQQARDALEDFDRKGHIQSIASLREQFIHVLNNATDGIELGNYSITMSERELKLIRAYDAMIHKWYAHTSDHATLYIVSVDTNE